MLTTLQIHNVVLIDRLQIDFAKGLSTLTGETGAGKSILLDALGLALGARADSGLVRAGTDQAQVSACFDAPHLKALLEENGLVAEDNLILRRQVMAGGRSKAFINDQPVSVALLKQVGAALVEIHGQFDTQSLLNPATHCTLLDQFANLHTQVADVGALYHAWQKAEDKLAEMRLSADEADKQRTFLEQAVEDLEELSPKVGEEQSLLASRVTLQHREAIISACQHTHNAIMGDEGADEKLVSALKILEKTAVKAGPLFDETIAKLSSLRNELEAVVADVEALVSSGDEAGGSLEELDDRLHALRQMARRYNCQPDELAQKLEAFQASLALASSGTQMIDQQQQVAHQAAEKYIAAAKKLSAKRIDAAKKLDKAVMQELPPLKLEKATFETHIKTSVSPDAWSVRGIDEVTFLVATNPGAPAGPLAKIASGGEMARFMLALKVVLASSDGPGCLVFDEVDSGISGATADAVGQRLGKLAQTQQILVVTHSPQVAARADHHYVVQKTSSKTETLTRIHALSDKESRREEIARMLSGASITDEARAAAHKLLEKQAA